MRKIFLLFIALLLLNALNAQRWSVDQVKLWQSKLGWRVGANYTPAFAINQLEFWQKKTFDTAAISKELSWAAAIGMNCMRVYLHHEAWKQDPKGFKDRVNEYLAIANRKGIKTVVTIFDDCWNTKYQLGKQPDPCPGIHNSGWLKDPGQRWYDGEAGLEATLKNYVTDILRHFKKDDRILLWDLYNEPGWSEQFAKAYDLADKVFQWAWTVRPIQPLTICVWNNDSAFKLLNKLALERSDIVSYHNYQSADKHQLQIDTLKKYKRPLVCTEYMARKHKSTFQTILPLLKKENVMAINWGLVDGKTQTKYAWDERQWGSGEPELWFHDIFRRDGTPYLQEEVDLIKKLSNEK